MKRKFTLSSSPREFAPEDRNQSIPDSQSHTHLREPCGALQKIRSCRTNPGQKASERKPSESRFKTVRNQYTITRITTHGKFKDLTISMATEVLPEPELPAMPMILKSCHGGEYRTSAVGIE
jgi:hypothetical protein